MGEMAGNYLRYPPLCGAFNCGNRNMRTFGTGNRPFCLGIPCHI